MNSQARKQKPSGYWTKERVFEEAKKYTSRKAFSNGNGTAYKIASKNGWLDEMPWMNIAPKKCFEESRKYTSRGAFQKGSVTAYGIAQSNKWLDEMPWLKPQLKSWDKESVILEARKYPTKTLFHNNSSVAYRVALRNGWLEEIANIVGWNNMQ